MGRLAATVHRCPRKRLPQLSGRRIGAMVFRLHTIGRLATRVDNYRWLSLHWMYSPMVAMVESPSHVRLHIVVGGRVMRLLRIDVHLQAARVRAVVAVFIGVLAQHLLVHRLMVVVLMVERIVTLDNGQIRRRIQRLAHVRMIDGSGCGRCVGQRRRASGTLALVQRQINLFGAGRSLHVYHRRGNTLLVIVISDFVIVGRMMVVRGRRMQLLVLGGRLVLVLMMMLVFGDAGRLGIRAGR